jgi:hypothetical protein
MLQYLNKKEGSLMQIKYVGPKPLISKTEISFDPQYDDRYIYLNITVQLLRALDHQSFEEKTYQYPIDSQRLSDSDIINGLNKYCPNLESTVQTSIKAEQRIIDDEIKHVKENMPISETEKEALIKNMKMMQSYRLQYAINETVYNSAIQALATCVKEDHIDYIIVPMFQRFAAVLHSVQSELLEQKFPIDTKIDIYEENGKLMAKMEVKSR